MSRILPRFHRHQEAAHDRQTVKQVLLDSGADLPPEIKAGAGMHMDTLRLRGIPVVGGACGTSPGTDPYQAYVAKYESDRAA